MDRASTWTNARSPASVWKTGWLVSLDIRLSNPLAFAGVRSLLCDGLWEAAEALKTRHVETTSKHSNTFRTIERTREI